MACLTPGGKRLERSAIVFTIALGLVDLRTVREPGPRLIGNVVIEAGRRFPLGAALTVETLEALERHHLPGWRIPRTFAGHAVGSPSKSR